MDESKVFGEKTIRKYKQLVVFCLLVFVCYRWWNESMLHQLNMPEIFSTDSDNFFWLMHLLSIPKWLTSSLTVSWVFDLSIILLIFLQFVMLDNRWLTSFIMIWLTLYYVCFHSYFCHHGHSMIGIIILLIPFFTARKRTFMALKDSARFYLCFIYVSAALWKLFRGAFGIDHSDAVMMWQNAQYLSDQYDQINGPVIRFLLDSPYILQLGSLSILALELSFIVGFINKKFDKWLLVAMLSVHFGIWLAMDINFWEMAVASLLLCSATQINRLHNKMFVFRLITK